MNKSFTKMFGGIALAVASIVALNACSGENGVDGRDGKDGVSVTDTLYVFQKDTVIFAGDTIYISKKDTVLVKDTVILAGDTIVISKKDTVYIANGGSGNGGAGAGGNAGGGNVSYGTLVDERDGQTYRTTKIGDQVWMAENLNYAYLQPTAELDSSSFCYDNDPANCKKYGRLYLWSAAMDSAALFSTTGKGCGYYGSCEVYLSKVVRGVCPKGWHLPSRNEFGSLLNSVDLRKTQVITQKNLNAEAITKQDTSRAKFLKAEEWDGNDYFGFSVLPAGYYDAGYYFHREYAFFWSSTEYNSGKSSTEYSSSAYYLFVNNNNNHASVEYNEPIYRNKENGLSVRCLQD